LLKTGERFVCFSAQKRKMLITQLLAQICRASASPHLCRTSEEVTNVINL
jgi:hypothetical protein